MTAFCIILCCIAQTGPAISGAPRDVRCGSYCLFVAADSFGLAPSSFAQIEKALGDPGTSGYSMRQLELAAQGLGLKTIAVETTLERLRARPERFACIALLRGSHFVLVYDADESNILYVDPPGKGSLPIDTFRSNWTGKALLIGPEPFISEESVRLPTRWGLVVLITTGVAGAALIVILGMRAVRSRRRGGRAILACVTLAGLNWTAGCSNPAPASALNGYHVVPTSHELGAISTAATGGEVSVDTAIVNDGSRPLRIVSLRPSCSCVGLSMNRTEIPPGSRATLTARIALGNESGPRRTSVTIVTSDPEREAIEIPFTWEAVPPLVSKPENFAAGRLRLGQGFSNDLTISARDIVLCPNCRIEAKSDSPAVQCEFASKSLVSDSRTDRHEGKPRSGPLGTLRVEIEGSSEPRDYRQSINVRIVCKEQERARLTIPASWTVQPVVSLSPSRLSLGLRRPGERVTTRVMLHGSDGSPFLIHEIACGEPEALVGSTKEKSATPVQSITLEFQVPDTVGPWRSAVVLRTDLEGASELTLPVSALIANPDVP